MKPSSPPPRQGLSPSRTGRQGGSEDDGNAWRNAALPLSAWASLPRDFLDPQSCPLKGQMLLAKTSPWVAHQQINQGHGQGERLWVEE